MHKEQIAFDTKKVKNNGGASTFFFKDANLLINFIFTGHTRLPAVCPVEQKKFVHRRFLVIIAPCIEYRMVQFIKKSHKVTLIGNI